MSLGLTTETMYFMQAPNCMVVTHSQISPYSIYFLMEDV